MLTLDLIIQLYIIIISSLFALRSEWNQDIVVQGSDVLFILLF